MHAADCINKDSLDVMFELFGLIELPWHCRDTMPQKNCPKMASFSQLFSFLVSSL